MAIESQYLVGFRHEGELQFQDCKTLEEALGMIRARAETGHFDCELWQRVPFNVTVDVEVGGVTVPRTRKRRDSTGTATPDGSTPGQSSAAAASVDVRPPAAAAPAAPPAPPPAPGPVRPSCGGKACEVREGKDIHRMDPSCSKLMANRKGAAAR